MTARPRIRPAHPADIPALHRFLAALAGEIGHGAEFGSTPASLAAHGFGPDPHFRVLIAELAGEPVGLALYFPEYSTFRAAPGVYVQDLYLVPEARGGGLGRALLAAVAAAASAGWGATYLKLTADAGNAGALAFYARLGFDADPAERPQVLKGAAFAALAGEGVAE